MKYLTIAAWIVCICMLYSCQHTKYTEGGRSAVTAFIVGQHVQLSLERCSSPNFYQHLCDKKGEVVGYADIKNPCYPQLSYEIKFENFPDTYLFCAVHLILVDEGS